MVVGFVGVYIYQNSSNCTLKSVCSLGEFPGGPMVKASCFRAEGAGLIPGWGTQIPHASRWRSQKNKVCAV